MKHTGEYLLVSSEVELLFICQTRENTHIIHLFSRDVLAMSSQVFYGMFYGSLAKPEDQNKPIVVDDTDPEAFDLMLR